MIRSRSCVEDTEKPSISSITEKDNVKDSDKQFIFISSKFANHNKYSTIEIENKSIQFIPKPETICVELDPTVRRRKIRQLEQQEGAVHPKAKSQYVVSENQGPIRQYYHSRTNLPISLSEWEKGEDSDDEKDDFWIRQLGEGVSLWTNLLPFCCSYSCHFFMSTLIQN